MDSDGNICPICSVDNSSCAHAGKTGKVKISQMVDLQPNSPKSKIRVPLQNVKAGRGRAGYVGRSDQIEVYDPKYPGLNLVGGDETQSEAMKARKPKKEKKTDGES